MYKRSLAPFILESAKKFPILAIVGPRQSGKTTLCRSLFAQFNYINLESPSEREMAHTDPKGFLVQAGPQVIFDEIQRAPELLSYLQVMVDEPGSEYQFVLTGSEQLLLSDKINQSLAGRVRLFELLPLSHQELGSPAGKLDEALYSGGYPRIHDKQINPTEWFEQYVQTYIERDVREMSQIGDLLVFQRFMALCAGRCSQLVNFEALGNEAGVSQPTAKKWLSILTASFATFLLQPYHKSFSKRVVKTSKLYFYDTGLACYFLKIRTPQDLESHPLKGALFENWVVSESIKSFYNTGRRPPVYFWRDQKGHEVDLIIDTAGQLFPIEIKLGQTFQSEWLKNLDYFNSVAKQNPRGQIIYGGSDHRQLKEYQLKPWHAI